MRLKLTKNGSKKVGEFYAKEWKSVDNFHYGREVSWISWIPKHFTLELYEKNDIVSALTFTINQDVSTIELIITAEQKRRMGFGKRLIAKMEEISKRENVHKIYLQTGKNWDSVKFYEVLGYKKTGDLPNHYLHIDYIELTKFI